MSANMWVDLGIKMPEILVPAPSVDLKKWSVIACDQYTSEPEYWEEIDRFVGSSPSSLRVVLPEVYLEMKSPEWIDNKIQNINQTMRQYINQGHIHALSKGFILVDRSTPLHPSRKGLVLSIDLDQYDFTPGNTKKIRATEGTVLSRIPPRVSIRKDAMIELPHVLLLMDDPEHKVIEAAFDQLQAESSPTLYDTPLMLDGGHLRGYFVSEDSRACQIIVKGLSDLLSASEDGLLFVVGDGNHSLATAKAHWNNIKKDLPEDLRADHPARFALVEIENIHDKGIDFEPIHRVVFGLSLSELIDQSRSFWGTEQVMIEACEAAHSSTLYGEENTENMCIYLTDGEQLFRMTLRQPGHLLEVGAMQNLLDHIFESNNTLRIDYIHGYESVIRLSNSQSVGILLPPISKNYFFDSLSRIGVYPRKTFSMGESIEKRFYLEAKYIIDQKGE